MTKIVKTAEGNVKLVSPPAELLRAIRAFLPFGLLGFDEPQRGANYGLVVQCGERELRGVKAPVLPQDIQNGMITHMASRMFVANSLAGYLRNGFSGLLMPCPYVLDMKNGQIEPGTAYFGVPSSRGRESQEFPADENFDLEFGDGFFEMTMHFVRAESASSNDLHITMPWPLPPVICPQSQLGAIDFSFMLVGPRIVYLKAEVQRQDIGWLLLRKKGIKQVYHVPAVPVKIDESLLASAKG
jgi:hypothetical protein